ncbi:hypothetical protein SteCoe_31902 [Stentor coeruleus]|uniref:Fucolectin tachylectin-4 pentraxin-1 domain-containing protein n=1 Tax=Stentor coeruleus TaxID=5963 RepID=A0A1R2B076_9CILI|nr:hypothetical protein SteCoe_31902 [Stentor coeruleus]
MELLFLGLILLLDSADSCTSLSNINFKFYVTSGTNDWVVSEQYPNGAYASVVSAVSWAVVIPPETSWIWESPVIFVKTITVTRYFFVPGKLISVSFIGATDDYSTVKINGGTSCSIPNFDKYYSCDFTSSVIPGLNKLEIIGVDLGPAGANIMYKLTIVSKIV